VTPLAILSEPWGAVFRFELGHGAESCADDCLSPGEQARAARFVHECDARRYRSAHRALRRLLAQTRNCEARDLTFDIGPWGKPALVGARPCRFNLSYRDDSALVAMSQHLEVGVDIERVGTLDDPQGVAEQIMSIGEREAWLRLASSRQAEALAACFARKEAVLKALGCGLSLDPSRLDIGWADGTNWVQVCTAQGVRGVQVRSIELDGDWAAAVATVEAGPGPWC
jgi:4'-phosphopantetheinyl transferase